MMLVLHNFLAFEPANPFLLLRVVGFGHLSQLHKEAYVFFLKRGLKSTKNRRTRNQEKRTAGFSHIPTLIHIPRLNLNSDT